jgi:hypothetical protein
MAELTKAPRSAGERTQEAKMFRNDLLFLTLLLASLYLTQWGNSHWRH